LRVWEIFSPLVPTINFSPPRSHVELGNEGVKIQVGLRGEAGFGKDTGPGNCPLTSMNYELHFLGDSRESCPQPEDSGPLNMDSKIKEKVFQRDVKKEQTEQGLQDVGFNLGHQLGAQDGTEEGSNP